MNSLLYYYNNVQKMAAYRQAKRMQRGVLTAQGGFSTTDPALLQMPCTIQCVFVAKEFRSERTQILFDTRGDSVGPRIDITTSNNLFVASNYISISKPAILDKIYDVVFAVSKDSTDVYIDGEKEATLASGEANMTRLNLGANSAIFYGDWLMYRQFNYLMSADEVKALDNNNDPMGYVVPKAKRGGLLAEYLPQNLMEYPNAGDLDVLSPNSYTWTGPDDSNYGISIPLSGYITAKKCVVTIEVSNYEAGAPFFKISTSNSTSIPQQNGTFELEQIILGDAYNRVAIYGGNEGTDRRMTITVKGIRQINGISYSWLDSAKQMPLSDEYMEPLFQPIGGYDMAANGAPEILYNE